VRRSNLHINCVPNSPKRKAKGDCLIARAMAESNEFQRQSVNDQFFGRVDVECNMCGDVGFADQLLLCTGCKWHVQHSYCCTSKKGVENGTWLCDRCRFPKQWPAKKDFKGCKPHPIIVKPRSIALDFLVQVALSPTELGDVDVTPDFKILHMDCGSYTSSSLSDEKMGADSPAGHLVGERERSRPSENKSSATNSDEEGISFVSPKTHVKDVSTRKAHSSKSNNKHSKQASVPEVKYHLSSIPSHQLKRLSSLKASSGPCTPPRDGSSKGFTPRFKSLLDISC